MSEPQYAIGADSTLDELNRLVDDALAALATRPSPPPVERDKLLEVMVQRVTELRKEAGFTDRLTVEEWLSAESTPPEPEPEPEPDPEPDETAAQAALETSDYFWVDPRDEKLIGDVIEMRRSTNKVANILDCGPSGAGKTTKFARLAAEHGIPFYKIDCPSVTTTEDWLGHKEIVAGEGGTRTEYHLSRHLEWLAGNPAPGMVLYDEVNRLHPAMLNVLIAILDGSKRVWVPELGTYAEVHPETIICATANIGAGFHGTYPLDDALAGRFGYRLETSFPPHAQEVRVLRERSGIHAKMAERLVSIAEIQRVQVPDNFERPVSTRNLLDAAAIIARYGYSIPDAATYTFLRLYSNEGDTASERTRLMAIVSGKTRKAAA